MLYKVAKVFHDIFRKSVSVTTMKYIQVFYIRWNKGTSTDFILGLILYPPDADIWLEKENPAARS